MVKHIFFDLDRTLWDFEVNSHETLLELCVKYNLNDLGINDYESFIKRYKCHNEKLWVLYRNNSISQKELRKERFHKTLSSYNIFDPVLATAIGEDYIDLCPKKNKLFPFAIEVLQYLSEKYSLHIITNGFEKVQHIKLECSDLHKYFNKIITSEQVGVKKPDSKIFEFALSESAAIAQESIYVGDDLVVDIIGCQACGIDGVYFNPDKKKHDQCPKYEISCLSELKELF